MTDIITKTEGALLPAVLAEDVPSLQPFNVQPSEELEPRGPRVGDGAGSVPEAARSYIHCGLRVLPMKPFGPTSDGKEPDVNKWQGEAAIKYEDVALKFSKPGAGVAVVLGSASRGIVDLDYDWREAMLVADSLEGIRPAFGRDSMPTSHRLARCPDAEHRVTFTLPVAAGGHPKLPAKHGLMVVEVRGNDCITVFPPSPHGESGETRRWADGFTLPPEQPWAEVVERAGLVAFLAVAARLYPPVGVRKMFSQALANVLLRKLKGSMAEGDLVKNVDGLVQMVARINHPASVAWSNLTTETAERISAGKPAVGMKRLVKLLGLPAECEALFKAWLMGDVNYDERPRVLYAEGETTRVSLAIDAALSECNAPIYQRDKQLVHAFRLNRQTVDEDEAASGIKRPPGSLVIDALPPPRLYGFLNDHICFSKIVRTKKGVEFEKVAPCPRTAASDYSAYYDQWTLRELQGIAETPFMRPDASVVATDGYDAATRIILDTNGVDFPPVPESPTREDALGALKHFDTVLEEFPFGGNTNGLVRCADRSVALAEFLTVLVVGTLPAVPLCLNDASKAGHGKGLLSDCVAITATGRVAAKMAAGANEEEMEKRLGGVLLRGGAMLVIDNVEAPLSGDTLNSAITEEVISVRILGTTGQHDVAARTMFIATGNNLQVNGDLVRRSIKCRLDSGEEMPEQRSFKITDLKAYVLEHRPQLVTAALTIMRAFAVAPDREDTLRKLTPFGNFERWSERVRAPLVWLGESDPLASQESVRGDDSVGSDFTALVTAWVGCPELGLGTIETGVSKGWHTANEVSRIANQVEQSAYGDPPRYPELNAALKAVLPKNIIAPQTLGTYLAKVDGRISVGLRLRKRRSRTGIHEFLVERHLGRPVSEVQEEMELGG